MNWEEEIMNGINQMKLYRSIKKNEEKEVKENTIISLILTILIVSLMFCAFVYGLDYVYV